MKFCKKLLSVLLSLVLCGSMVAPAFAEVTFADLNNAINADFSESQQGEPPLGKPLEGGGYGYGNQNQENNKYEIEARDQDGTRHVEVNTNVTYDAEKDGNDNTSIYIGNNKNVNLELGKNTITGTKDASVIILNNGGDPDGTNTPAPEVTITGGIVEGGIDVGQNAELTLDGTTVKNGGIHADVGAAIELTDDVVFSGNDGKDVCLEYGENYYKPDSDGKTPCEGASINNPNGTWVNADNPEQKYTEETVTPSDKSLTLTWVAPATGGGNGEGGNNGENTTSTTTDVEITDPNVPMSQGPVSCAEFIYKMWVLDGEPEPLDDRGLPEGVDEDHEYAPAIAWAASAGIVPMDAFDTEALLTVALARGFLTNFAAYADMAMPELTTLTGKDGDLVMNSDDVLDEFFGGRDSA